MLKIVNNGLEIKNRHYHSFIQKPQNRTIYVDNVIYQLPMPFMIFSVSLITGQLTILAFKNFMIKNNKLEYNPNNLPNQNSYGNFCVGDKAQNVYQLISLFYNYSFKST